MKYLRIISIALAALFLVMITGNAAAGAMAYNGTEYGVFLGLSDDDVIRKTAGYKLVVVDGQEISKDSIKVMHLRKMKVYAYLDVGSLETYRDYYERFRKSALDPYENWPDEYWMDVSDTKWQEFLSDELARDFYDKGFDGFFIDNADVYYQYRKDSVYNGLVAVIKGLGAYKKDILINGGDAFVKRLIKEGQAGLIDGINQESVFSSILDYEKDRFGTRDKEDTEYFKEYIESAAKAGLDVYLLEYTKDPILVSKIRKYCRKNGFKYYISSKVGLD